MKLKPYMRGMGIGIILTTLILTIGNPKVRLSDQEVITRAKELGMVEGENNNSNLEQILSDINLTGEAAAASITPIPELSAQPTAIPTISLTQAPTIAPTQTPVPTAEPVMPTIKPTDVPVPTSIPASDNNTGNGTEITFTIKSGMSSGMVAALLVEVGLIDNSEDFNQYVVNEGKASIIRVGTYTMPKESTYEEIVRKITTK